MSEDIFKFADEWGPAKIIHVYEPPLALKGIVVVDNVAAGPAIGGMRMAPDVSVSECFRLARAMTLKNAAAGLPHGGAKSVLFGDPKMPIADKERLLRAMACAIRDVHDYIVGPDMGVDETCMAWIYDEIGRAAGLPRELGGIPLDEIGATGWGVLHATEIAVRHSGVDLHGARVVVQGFGAVGKHAARFLASKGAILVGAADSTGTLHDPKGLDIEALLRLKNAGQSISAYTHGEVLARDAVIELPCDIWIPAARPDVIHAGNMHRLMTKMVVQGANIPVTEEAEKYLHEHGTLCVPDFIANAGGVICAAMEYQGATQAAVFAAIEEKLRSNTEEVLKLSTEKQILPRTAALKIATQKVKNAMRYRRWH